MEMSYERYSYSSGLKEKCIGFFYGLRHWIERPQTKNCGQSFRIVLFQLQFYSDYQTDGYYRLYNKGNKLELESQVTNITKTI